MFLLVLPSLPARTSVRLETVVRVSIDGHRNDRCVLIEIPVPAGITLHLGAAIALTVCMPWSTITLSIPATGHIHCATCNHEKADIGDVWRAVDAGDAAALEAALAAGGSTEEGGVSRLLVRTSFSLISKRLACHSSPPHSSHASEQGRLEAVRILLSAGADVNSEGQVRLCTTTSK